MDSNEDSNPLPDNYYSTNFQSSQNEDRPFKDTFLRKVSSVFRRNNQNEFSTEEGPSYVELGALHERSDTRTLGTFAGVFSPVSLSMFAALIFLRMGYIVGNAGLLVTLLQFGIAYAILVFTVMSVCAISTNGAVEGGGAYFMISRTLGPEFGGSIGTLFFFANIVGSGLCISGCVEGLVENFGPSGYLVAGIVPDGRWWQFLYCTSLNVLNLIVCLIGASMFAKTTVFVLAIVCGALSIMFFSFFYEGFQQVAIPDSNTLVKNVSTALFANYTGLSGETLASNLYPHYGRDYTAKGELVTFATVFGVLFSGVTGIMAGANMSGELKSPGKSIPRGTLSAVTFTLIIYLGISLLTAATCTVDLMHNNYLFLVGVSTVPASVAIGLFTATWSAALSNVIGASRVLEALAKDNIFGPVLGFVTKGTWKGNPVAAVLLSSVLVQLVLLIGSLNMIAQLNSVLFLLSYLATNLACLGLELASAPNFRPSFKYFTWHTALIGLFGTAIMMFVISPIYASCSILICVLLFLFLHVFSPLKEPQWGSISQALIFHQVRKYLLLLDSRKDHVKFWRPQILLMVNSPRSACPLIDFINDLKKGGLYVMGHVIKEDSDYRGPDPAIEQQAHWLALIDHLKVKAFAELTVALSVRDGLKHLARISGMGAMKPNTVVLGFLDGEEPQDFLDSLTSPYRTDEISSDIFPLDPENHLKPSEYVQMMSDVLLLKKNLCVCRNFTKLNRDIKKSENSLYIDVWPVNFLNPNDNDAFDTTSLFMMQLACIVNMVPVWKKLKLRVCVCEPSILFAFTTNGQNGGHPNLKSLLKDLRISAQLNAISGWQEVLESRKKDMNQYLDAINKLILRHSSDTSVTFIYLPPPSTDSSESESYLACLERISRQLPPTIFVHGISTVTSTTL